MLTGKLVLRDEAGYRRYHVLHPDRPICTLATPDRPFWPAHSRVTDISTFVHGDRADEMADRLERLGGNRVRLEGSLFGAETGYHRTEVLIYVDRITPIDIAGESALQKTRSAVVLRDVASYDVTVRTGPRLKIDVAEHGASRRLVPAEAYAPYWMTGLDVFYVNCRTGDRREAGSSPLLMPVSAMSMSTVELVIHARQWH